MFAKFFCLCLLCFLFSTFSYSESSKRYPRYAGIIVGYGSTTWTGLVPCVENQNAAMSMSTPIGVEEGGVLAGAYAGYEFFTNFALEASYMHYPTANVYFSAEDSIFAYNNNGLTQFTTETETVNLMAKIELPIPTTAIHTIMGAGGALLHRKDMLNNAWRITPTFSVGLNTDFTPRLLGEISAQYTAGYGEVQIDPTSVYFPFLYAIYARLAIRW